MRGLTHAGVICPQIAAYGAQDNLARIQSNADRKRHAMRVLNLVPIALDAGLDFQRRITRPHRVVFVGDRCSEQSHDAIAHDVIDGAFVVVDRLDHAFDHGIEEALRIFRIPPDHEFHRPFDVGEHHSDLFTFTFDCRFVSENLIGEMERRVILGRGRAEIFLVEAHRMAALRAEIRSCGKLGSATNTAPTQRRSALLAELYRDRVLVLTCRAFHPKPCSKAQSIA
jgi:hypothetical protein